MTPRGRAKKSETNQAGCGAPGASSGYGLAASLPAGVYDLAVHAHSAATGTFNNVQVVRVTVR